LNQPGIFLYLIGLWGPLVSSIIVTFHIKGKGGIRLLLSSGLKWRFSIAWYLFAILIVGILMFINIGLHIGNLPKPSAWINFSILPIVVQVWVVIGEEYGWRGFALPQLQLKYGSLGASIILGFLWACWHLPMFFISGSPQYTENFLTSFSGYVLILIFWTIIMAMLYNKTRKSVLVCMLFHASANISAFLIDMPLDAESLVYLYIPVVLFAIFLLPRPLLKRTETI
ncbi:MAG: CPBP family intramembrane glutamic endopeptidase, partial [Bacteroidota bacterium]